MKTAIHRMSVFGLICVMFVGLVGCGSGETPEAVFEVAKKAGQSKDYSTLCQCMTEESQEVFAGTLVLSGGMMKAFGGMAAGFGRLAQNEEAKKKMEEMQKNLAKIDTLFEKHGVTEESMQKVNSLQSQGPPENPVVAMKELASAVKDKPAFISEMLGLMESLDEGGSGRKPSDMFGGELTDLMIEGETATGFVVTTEEGVEDRDEISFKKVNGKWLFDLTAMIESGKQ